MLWDDRFEEHVGPRGHPECPERLRAIRAGLEALRTGFSELCPRPAGPDELARVHSREWLTEMAALAGRRLQLDADTFVSPRSIEVATLAAGGTLELALRVARGEAPRGIALVRPPGHHAESARAMGFCLFNHVAVAARALQAETGIERIAIIDWDVHHGNGTQSQFLAERDVLYLSLHQYPFYPGSGSVAEIGVDGGEGATVNLPLPAGYGDAEYLAAFDAIALPVLREFGPEMVLVSAGFDAHVCDPLAGMRVTTEGFRALARQVRRLADEACGGRLVAVLEGGYDPEALSESVRALAEVMQTPEPLAASTPAAEPTAPTRQGAKWDRLAALREAHASRWKTLERRAVV